LGGHRLRVTAACSKQQRCCEKQHSCGTISSFSHDRCSMSVCHIIACRTTQSRRHGRRAAPGPHPSSGSQNNPVYGTPSTCRQYPALLLPEYNFGTILDTRTWLDVAALLLAANHPGEAGVKCTGVFLSIW
jgi:hypothetical protein